MRVQELATAIVKRLVQEGYIAFFAGGWVRDFALGHPSSDIDIATSAKPQEIIALFDKTLQVGISFGVVVVVEEGHTFEVATFREDLHYIHGRKPEKIVFSSPEEDAKRRDFTINGMFYDPLEDKVHDFVGGMDDLKIGIVRTIGDAWDRFREDRLRMIRAVRFAARFDFKMDEGMQKAICDHAATLLPAVAMERVHQEFAKMAAAPRFDQAICDLHRLGLLPVIFPLLARLPLEEIAKRVSSFSQFPIHCPVELYLQELFPHLDPDELMDLFATMKMSNRELKRAHFFREHLPYLTGKMQADRLFWARFHSHPDAPLSIAVLAATRGEAFHREQNALRERLQTHIQRIKDGKRIVTSAHLTALGIPPGVKMGQLLDKAEEIAINEDLQSPETILKKMEKELHGN